MKQVILAFLVILGALNVLGQGLTLTMTLSWLQRASKLTLEGFEDYLSNFWVCQIPTQRLSVSHLPTRTNGHIEACYTELKLGI